MKKSTMTAIVSALTAIDAEKYADLIAEVNIDLNRDADIKAKNAEAYESIHALVVNALTDTPATCAEIFTEIEDELPEGMSKGKVQYALTHLWQDEIVKIEGKPNTYRRA